ncbi:hypothetical protein ACJBU6_06552 [Exserohilum turcicum]
MKEPRSIILTVVSAKNDYANQIVLKLARTADKTGTRTLGVITKPDTLVPGSDSEAMYISLAKNPDVEFRLGWHCLRNMDSETGSGARSNRDEEETKHAKPSLKLPSTEPTTMTSLATRRLTLATRNAFVPSYRTSISLFPETMTREGHHFVVTDSSDASLLQVGRPKENILSRSGFLKRIESLMNRTRGREFPGTFNPMVVSDLFFEQSSPWEELARAHIVQIMSAVRIFLKHLTSYVSDTSTCGALFQTLVEPALERISKNVKSKAADLLASHQRGHPITYNHYFTETVQQVRKERTTSELTRIIKDVFGVSSLHPSGQSRYIEMDYRPLLNALVSHTNPDLNQYACSEALDCMQAYYKVALKRFVDDIAVEAVEKDIIAKLSDIVSPIRVASLASDVVTDIAGESKESRAKRSQLETQLGVLVQGLETCKRFMVETLQCKHQTMLSADVICRVSIN